MVKMIEKIISGGQTGAARSAFEVLSHWPFHMEDGFLKDEKPGPVSWVGVGQYLHISAYIRLFLTIHIQYLNELCECFNIRKECYVYCVE